MRIGFTDVLSEVKKTEEHMELHDWLIITLLVIMKKVKSHFNTILNKFKFDTVLLDNNYSDHIVLYGKSLRRYQKVVLQFIFFE